MVNKNRPFGGNDAIEEYLFHSLNRLLQPINALDASVEDTEPTATVWTLRDTTRSGVYVPDKPDRDQFTIQLRDGGVVVAEKSYQKIIPADRDAYGALFGAIFSFLVKYKELP